jgi:hypothetical protein
MPKLTPPGRSLIVWAGCCVAAGLTFLLYASASLAAGRGQFMMPLDDVYIHFQYARQLAEGQPYVYNPGQPPTSGATSFLYPYVLALGYRFGFQGLALGAWAMGLGAVAFALSIRLVYAIFRQWGGGEPLALIGASLFALTGAVQWHFMSGMETGLVIVALLLTLYGFNSRSQWVAGGLLLLALLRPEGGLLAGITTLILLWRGRGFLYRVLPLLVTGIAISVQPLVNLLLTGSAVASGNAAKSVFGMIPFDAGLALQRVIEQFIRMWVEISTGISPREGLYLLPLLLLLALVGWGRLAHQRETRPAAVMLALWLLTGTAAVATLDTAFWHFKRYQMPFMVLLFPLAMVGLLLTFEWLQRFNAKWQSGKAAKAVGILGIVAASILALHSSSQFLQHFALNAGYVYAQPYQMAQWLIANTSPEATVAVHDTGLIRYIGGRTTLDMVGLTTPGAADYWRNGPGSVAELLMQEQPDYIAAYGSGHGVGLSYLAETRLYGSPLVSFAVPLDDHFNVALAAAEQGIYRPDWGTLSAERAAHAIQPYGAWDWGTLVSSVNVADLDSERAAGYAWRNPERLAGFPTEVFDLDYLACYIASCRVVDGGRRITGEEQFTLDVPLTLFGERNVLVTRLLPMGAGTLAVYADDQLIATRVIPDVPGRWIEVPTLIPDSIYGTTRIRILPTVPGGVYAPYFHWLYRQPSEAQQIPSNPHMIVDYPTGVFRLSVDRIEYAAESRQFAVEFAWQNDGSARGDYRLFVHVYGAVDQPPVLQVDHYPGGGALPPGNWLPGVIRDRITLDFSSLPAGRYAVALGLYNPYTGERLLTPAGDDSGRVFFQEVVIP